MPIRFGFSRHCKQKAAAGGDFEASLVARMSFLQDHGEAAPAQTEALFYATGNGHFGSITGNAKALAENPHAS
jgi:hypothetical protein